MKRHDSYYTIGYITGFMVGVVLTTFSAITIFVWR